MNATLIWRKAAACLALAALLAGCKTSTVESRRLERQAAYSSLTPEQREAVDCGQIKAGMPMDAVFIAWGKPAQVLTGESGEKKTVTWLYTGTRLEEYHFWNQRPPYAANPYYSAPYMDVGYVPRNYTRAEVVFEDGVVKSWRTVGANKP